MKSSLEVLLKEDLPLGDVPQQQLHGDAQLGHVLLESIGRVLGSFSRTLNQIFVGLGVVQLYRLDTSLIIVEPRTTNRKKKLTNTPSSLRSGGVNKLRTLPIHCCWPALGRCI